MEVYLRAAWADIAAVKVERCRDRLESPCNRVGDLTERAVGTQLGVLLCDLTSKQAVRMGMGSVDHKQR